MLGPAIWANFKSPFDSYNRRENVSLPLKNWKRELEDLINSQVLTRLAKMEEEIDRLRERASSARVDSRIGPNRSAKNPYLLIWQNPWSGATAEAVRMLGGDYSPSYSPATS
jgi:hypothetical protein